MTNPKIMLAFRALARLLSLGGRLKLAQTLCRRCFRHAEGVVRVSDFDGGIEIELRLSEHMQRRIFWMGYYNREIVALLKKIMTPGMVLIDVGANIGEITLVSAKLVGPEGLVVAFEPISGIATALEQNIERNHLGHVTVVRQGLSDTEGSAPIYSSCGQGDENEGLGSLYHSTEVDRPLETIDLTTLDSYLAQRPISRLDMIKVDIEGAELAFLRGAEDSIRRYQPHLIIEVQEQTSTTAGYKHLEILEFLTSLGYTFQSIGRGGRLTKLNAENLTEYQNVLCTPSSK